MANEWLRNILPEGDETNKFVDSLGDDFFDFPSVVDSLLFDGLIEYWENGGAELANADIQSGVAKAREAALALLEAYNFAKDRETTRPKAPSTVGKVSYEPIEEDSDLSYLVFSDEYQEEAIKYGRAIHAWREEYDKHISSIIKYRYFLR